MGPRFFHLAIARAIARDRGKALPLSPDNTPSGPRISIDEAVAGDLCFCIDVADDILAFDIDRADAQARSRPFAELLRSHGLRPVTVASGRPGHEHVIVRVNGRACRAWVAAEAASRYRLHPRRSIRPPLVPHRLGLPVSLVEPQTASEALRALVESGTGCSHPDVPKDRGRSLGAAPRGPVAASPSAPPPHVQNELDALLGPMRSPDHRIALRTPPPWGLPLPAWANERLVNGGDDRSQGLIDVARAAIQAGWTLAMFIAALEDPENRLGAKYREDSTPYIVAARAWAAAQEFLAGLDGRPEPSEDLLAFGRAALTPLPGRGGVHLRRLLCGIYDFASDSGRATNIPLTERSIEGASGLARGTVHKYLPIAVSQGWLVLETPQRGGLAARYALSVPDGIPPGPLPSWGSDSGSWWLSPAHDAFQRGGLRPTSWEVHIFLGGIPVGIADVATASGRHPEAVRKALHQLARVGLAKESDLGWVRGGADLAEVAAQFGTDGKARDRRLRHRLEREDYRRIAAGLARKAARHRDGVGGSPSPTERG